VGRDQQSGGLFSYVDLEGRVPADHPLRLIRTIVDEALRGLSGEFEALYSCLGRPSIPPERLLRALLLQPAGPCVGVRPRQGGPVDNVRAPCGRAITPTARLKPPRGSRC
jgi:hypothetical protein